MHQGLIDQTEEGTARSPQLQHRSRLLELLLVVATGVPRCVAPDDDQAAVQETVSFQNEDLIPLLGAQVEENFVSCLRCTLPRSRIADDDVVNNHRNFASEDSLSA